MEPTRYVTRLMLALATPLLATACVQSPPIYAPKTPCSRLVPESLRKRTPDAPAPAAAQRPADEHDDALMRAYSDAIAKAWMAFGVAQTGQLAKANDRADAIIEIEVRCQQRDADAIDRAKPKFLGIF